MRCPICGFPYLIENKDGLLVCPSCGAVFPNYVSDVTYATIGRGTKHEVTVSTHMPLRDSFVDQVAREEKLKGDQIRELEKLIGCIREKTENLKYGKKRVYQKKIVRHVLNLLKLGGGVIRGKDVEEYIKQLGKSDQRLLQVMLVHTCNKCFKCV